ncbi:aminodeoxychorismate synthase component I [Membranihabitans marinus]|uniref:aminodeoxychorismate synthase component I n=1 Tax=Membranihabitans marinus TaxID=1227546 RepID=UPI001F0040EF|nr:aminodeoxychorismate synthase component I [Membranihabitans marinus]
MISYDQSQSLIVPASEMTEIKDELLFEIGDHHLDNCETNIQEKDFTFNPNPLSFEEYLKKFEAVQAEISAGNTYLLNLTAQTPLNTNMSLLDIYHHSKAKYKVYLKDKFVVFSPETFVQIQGKSIKTFPMKGTIDADIPNAVDILTHDKKEMAEHASIVDLLRNDLGKVSKNVVVNRFRYFDYVETSHKNLWQVSSEIEGQLPEDFYGNLGTILFNLLPAGSITGVPKANTVNIISEVEEYDRGFYTGVLGFFDGYNLDSAVMIRFIEQFPNQLVYKSGGGIHSLSQAFNEYEELIQKIYVPIPRNHLSQQ